MWEEPRFRELGGSSSWTPLGFDSGGMKWTTEDDPWLCVRRHRIVRVELGRLPLLLYPLLSLMFPVRVREDEGADLAAVLE